jgi:hypothetical protein
MRRILVTLALALTVVAFLTAEADFWDESFLRADHHHTTTVLTSFRVAHRGEIELDETQSRIVSMSPDARLQVAERRFFTRRRLEVRPDASGRPQYEFAVGSRERNEEEGREFLDLVMEDVVRVTTIGAHSRARRVFEADGMDGLLDEVARLDSNSARRIYIEIAADVEGLTEEEAVAVIRTAGREITSSSRLRSTLVELAEDLPAEWAVTAELIAAAENISSSGVKAEALTEFTRVRGLQAEEAVAMAEAISTISSSGEVVRTVQRIARLAPSPEIIEEMLEPIAGLHSSGDRRRALEDLVSYPDLADSAYQRALELSRDIASSGERASFLGALANKMPQSEAMLRQYIEVAGSITTSGDEANITTSGDEANALTVLLREAELSAELCRFWIETVGQVSSSGTAASLLSEASRHCPDEERVWNAYLAAVREIPSSGDQRRALMALMERDGLDSGVVEQVIALAEQAIASTGESRQVTERAQSLLTEPPVASD